MMLRTALVNMPFANWYCPSFALSQLAALTEREFPGAVESDVLYLNQDFATYFGVPEYRSLATDVEHLLTGIGDWMFRRIAFPEAPDNSARYFRRYYRGPRWSRLSKNVLHRRDGLERYCRELIARYDLASYDVVGFTSMFTQNVPSMAIARLVKEINPDVVTVMGGANCEAPMGAVIAEHVPAVDFVFSGPALRTYPDLLRALLSGNPAAAHAVPGIVSRHNCGDPRFRTAVGPERDIDEYLLPDYSAFLSSLSGNPELLAAVDDGNRPHLYFETSRGCWWGERSHCTFCGLNGLGMNYRAMSPAKAIRQFEWLFDLAPWARRFHCTDNIMPRSYPKEVFGKLDPPPGTSIFYEVKLPVADRDLAAMASGGVTQVQPGIESLSTQTLHLMGKGTTVFHNLQFLKNCARHGIEPLWNLLIGFPGEPESVYEKYSLDLPLLSHLPPPTGVYVVRFDRFSPYHVRPDDYGLRLRPSDHYAYVYPFPETDLPDLAYYFTDENLGAYAVNSTRWHGRLHGLVEEWKNAWSGGPPSLVLERDEHGRTRVRDSRPGWPASQFAADEPTQRMLRRLASPARPDRLPADLGLPEEVVADRLALLRERRLLFEEDDRVLSLVMTEVDGTAEVEEHPRTLQIIER